MQTCKQAVHSDSPENGDQQTHHSCNSYAAVYAHTALHNPLTESSGTLQLKSLQHYIHENKQSASALHLQASRCSPDGSICAAMHLLP